MMVHLCNQMQCVWRPRDLYQLKGFSFIEYQVYNGYLASSTVVHRHHLEKIILVAFDASIITITRDATVLTPNKYTVHPASLEVDQSEVWMDA